MTQGKDYRSVKGVSNSLMSVYEDDYPSFVSYWVYNQSLPQKSTASLTMGSQVDILLTQPQNYDRVFTVFKGESPTGQMDRFCREVARSMKEGEKDPYMAAYKTIDFKLKRDTLEFVMEKFDKYKDFFTMLMNCRDCTVITEADDDKARKKFHELQTNPFTSPIVNAVDDPIDRIEVFHQLELFQAYKSIMVKGALDKVVVRHEEKMVFPIDYKTSFDTAQFEESYKKWRYYRQGSFYTFLIQEWMNERGIGHYTIAPFVFVVCSTTSSKHYIYRMHPDDIRAAEVGGQMIEGTVIKGWAEILDEIVFMTSIGNWTYPYKVAVNNGIVPLKIFK